MVRFARRPPLLPVLGGFLLAGLAAVPTRAGDPPAPGAPSAPPPEEGTSLTVYSSADPAGFDPQQFVAQQRAGADPSAAWQVPGYGIVKESRSVSLVAGRNELKLTDVAQFIDPTTVSFTDLTSPAGTAVLEQAFRFDLASRDKILERYLGATIAHEALDKGQVVVRVEGRVLSVNQGTVVLETKEGLRFLPTADPGLRLPALPEGLLTKPTLVWKLDADAAGAHRIRTTYKTAGLTWRADYTLVLDAAGARADLGAWVTLVNLSGASYRDTRLKLVAGDVRTVEPTSWDAHTPDDKDELSDGGSAGFEERSFFEYHLYTLPRRTDVLDAATQQIALFPTVVGATASRLLVYDGLPEAGGWGAFAEPRTDRDVGSQANPKLDVYVRFRNEKANRLGIPLPKGKVRVFQKDDADGTLEFVGEDLIDHTPKDETVLVKVGQAFDVVGDRTQTDFQVDTRRRQMTDSYRIVLRNHKDVPVTVLVREHLFRWTSSEILTPSDPFTKVDARTIQFEVTVPPNGEKAVTYAARYTW